MKNIDESIKALEAAIAAFDEHGPGNSASIHFFTKEPCPDCGGRAPTGIDEGGWIVERGLSGCPTCDGTGQGQSHAEKILGVLRERQHKSP